MSEPSMNEEKIVHHAAEHDDLPLAKAFRCARSGISFAFKTQRNFKIHLTFAALAIILGLILQIPQPSWLAIVVCIFLVIGMEMANTAIESIVDLASPGWNELAKRAKDCAAGAVYICAIGSIAVAAIVYVPAFLALIGM